MKNKQVTKQQDHEKKRKKHELLILFLADDTNEKNVNVKMGMFFRGMR